MLRTPSPERYCHKLKEIQSEIHIKHSRYRTFQTERRKNSTERSFAILRLLSFSATFRLRPSVPLFPALSPGEKMPSKPSGGKDFLRNAFQNSQLFTPKILKFMTVPFQGRGNGKRRRGKSPAGFAFSAAFQCLFPRP